MAWSWRRHLSDDTFRQQAEGASALPRREERAPLVIESWLEKLAVGVGLVGRGMLSASHLCTVCIE